MRRSATLSRPLRRLARRSQRAMRARGLSMVELLVVIGIVLAIGALVLPWSLGWLSGRELDNAEDRLAMQLVLARAAARDEGRPVVVVANPEGAECSVEVRFMESGDAARALGPAGSDSRSSMNGPGRSGAEGALDADEDADLAMDDGADSRGSSDGSGRDAAADPASVFGTWARLRLPPGISIGPASAQVAADPVDAAEEALALEDSSASEAPQTLAIFLPDGTTIVAPLFMLRSDAGMQRALRVDRVTGRPRASDAPAKRTEPEDAPDLRTSPFADRPEFDLDPAPRRR
ncbi:MAG: Tfp pilus assembly protein FimT/FimU [Planctomycetota bacterium]